MNTKSFQSLKREPLPDKRVFYIVGPRRMKNELLSYYLEKETGARCLMLEDMDEIFVSVESSVTQNPTLAFLDCQEKNPGQLLTELRVWDEKALSGVYLVLIHLPPNSHREEELLMKGVRGFLYEKDQIDWLVKGAQAVSRGELWLSRKKITKCLSRIRDLNYRDSEKALSLTPREVEILGLISTWATNDEIAEKLCISVNTVKTHVYKIFQKIGVSNRRHAAFWATKNHRQIIPKY